MEEFEWSFFLDKNKSLPVPEELFTHVEISLNNGIQKGMLLEVCHKTNPDVYWIAEITMVCGHLLRVKFIGAEEDFWCDLSNVKVHPLGWCGKHDEMVEPLDEINDKYGNKIIEIMKKTLQNSESVSFKALCNKGLSPIDRIKSGMKVEVQNVLDPYKYWIATVEDNVGGRLQLRYDGADEDLQHFWVFYSNPRLSNFGFVTNKGSPWQFKYPGKVNKFSCKNKLSAQLRQSAEESIKEPTPSDLFQPIENLEEHIFVTGMKLEALDPQSMRCIRPATVTKVFNDFHFLVVIDDNLNDYEDTKMAWLCNSKHPYIYPIGWAERNNIDFKLPKLWSENSFDWDEYLSITSSVPAPEYCFGNKTALKEIQVGMKLEAVNPLNNEEIHVANIDAIVEHMVCVRLLSVNETFWFAQNSDLLFPVSWCDSNNYELHIPSVNGEMKAVEVLKKEEAKPTPPGEWCDRIFFNYKCYAGPSMSRNKISQLPKHVGPGPLSLVVKEVMNKILSASYKPAKLLRDWESEAPPEEGMRLEMLKAKLKSGTYRAYVPVVAKSSDVASFCRDVCVKLQACPCLFGPNEYSGNCPQQCQQVEKSTFHNGTERRGRPKGCLNGKKKKAKNILDKKEKDLPQCQEVLSNKDGESVESEHSLGSTPPSDSGTRPNSADSVAEKKKLKSNKVTRVSYTKKDLNTKNSKMTNLSHSMKETHWDSKDCTKTQNSAYKTRVPDNFYSDTENDTNESSCNSRDVRNISDVSDSEEPELKKLKYSTYDPLPSDNKIFENYTEFSAINKKLRLPSNPLEWSIDDVFVYLSNTDDCKSVAERMREEEIDGQAFVMLDLSALLDFMHMKKEYARILFKHITRIKFYYLVNFDNTYNIS